MSSRRKFLQAPPDPAIIAFAEELGRMLARREFARLEQTAERLQRGQRRRPWPELRFTPDTHPTCRTLARLRIKRRCAAGGASAKVTVSSQPFLMQRFLAHQSMAVPVSSL